MALLLEFGAAGGLSVASGAVIAGMRLRSSATSDFMITLEAYEHTYIITLALGLSTYFLMLLTLR